MPTTFHRLSLAALSEKLRQRELSPVEITSAILARIEAFDARFGSYVTVLADRAIERAALAEAELARGLWRGPLHGVPVSLKDLCDTTFAPTAAGMPMRRNFRPARNATIVDRLEQAGAIILGKATMSEGAFSEHRAELPMPRNAWDPDRWPGASSSGSAIATALGLCYASIASDTGGSIRYPSACNGITGLKPTWGRVSRFGIVALAESMDHVGPMARTAEDCAIILRTIAGADANDPTALRAPVPDYVAGLDAKLDGVRVGIDTRYALSNAVADVAEAFGQMRATLGELGARIVDVPVPSPDEAIEAWPALCAAEAAVAHEATFAAHEREYGVALADLIRWGASLTARDLARLAIRREEFRGRLAALFQDVDLLLTPVLARGVPKLTEVSSRVEDRAWLRRFTVPFNLTGHPTITLPAGLDRDGLPIALQLVGRHLEEELLLRVAHAFQLRTDWHTRQPEPTDARLS